MIVINSRFYAAVLLRVGRQGVIVLVIYVIYDYEGSFRGMSVFCQAD